MKRGRDMMNCKAPESKVDEGIITIVLSAGYLFVAS